LPQDIPEAKFRVAGDPTITLSDIAMRIYADKLIDAAISPNTGKLSISFNEKPDQFIKGADLDAVPITALHPNICQFDKELGKLIGFQGIGFFVSVIGPPGKGVLI
jgi:hypothetical protein